MVDSLGQFHGGPGLFGVRSIAATADGGNHQTDLVIGAEVENATPAAGS